MPHESFSSRRGYRSQDVQIAEPYTSHQPDMPGQQWPQGRKESDPGKPPSTSHSSTSFGQSSSVAGSSSAAVPTLISNSGNQSPQLIFQHIHETALKRISTLDYLRKAYVHPFLYVPSYSFFLSLIRTSPLSEVPPCFFYASLAFCPFSFFLQKPHLYHHSSPSFPTLH